MHETFDATGQPCICWIAGREGRGRPDLYQHPGEWRDGVAVAFEVDQGI